VTKQDRDYLRRLVRTMYDYQDMRIRTAGRLLMKADETGMETERMETPQISEPDYDVIDDVREDSQKIEKILSKEIAKIVKAHPLWDAFFDGVKGCGPGMAAVILAEFDIEKATTVSKMWQYSGLNPGMVRGKKRKQGKGKDFEIIVTDEMVRGDRLTAGYVSPFNGWLRTKLVGVLADCMIKANSSYALDYYRPYKERLESEDGWSEESKGHRANAAKRYMIKMFIKDLYVSWRTVEGLTVRPSYQEEYLNHHHAG
jgi:hypothetical protein